MRMPLLVRDVRHALRMLQRQPAFAIVAILTLAAAALPKTVAVL